MSEQNNGNGLGEPQAADHTDGWSLVEIGGILAIAFGGFLVFGQLVAPRRLSGATRSAKLIWEQRQIEIQQVIASSEPAPAQMTVTPEQSLPKSAK